MKLHPHWLDWPQTQALVSVFPYGTLRFVGGAVRDALLGLEVLEVDAATTLLPQQVMNLLEKAGHRAIPTGIKHGTVTALIKDKPFEITTLRHDIACDGRHADVTFTGDWQQDAMRRDFTMNALYLSPEGELFDYTGGVADLQAGMVRFIGDPAQRIAEDYLRVLRFFRFQARYGISEADSAALAACKDAAQHLAKLSGERIHAEMGKLWQCRRADDALNRMQQAGILPAITGYGFHRFSAFERMHALAQQEDMDVPFPAYLALFLLHADITAEALLPEIATRWKLSHAEKNDTHTILRNLNTLKLENEAALKALKRRVGGLHMDNIILVHWAMSGDLVKLSSPYYPALEIAAQWQPPDFPLNGQDVIRAGIPAGPLVGSALGQMEALWEASGYTLTREQLLNHLRGIAG